MESTASGTALATSAGNPLDQSIAGGVRYRGGARLYIELGQDIPHVVGDRMMTDEKPVGDLAISAPFPD